MLASVVAKGESFNIDCANETITLEAEDVLIETKSAEGFSCGEEGGYLTALDTQLNDDLIKEGLARELGSSVQEARKKSGLDVSDRIILGISGSELVESALGRYKEFLMTETLAIKWQIGINDPLFTENNSLDEEVWLIELVKDKG